jgi:nitrate reductase cytochrome c-type subunit
MTNKCLVCHQKQASIEDGMISNTIDDFHLLLFSDLALQTSHARSWYHI